MSSIQSTPPPAEPREELRPPRPLAAQVLYQTFSRLTARLGLLWIAVVAIAAVFAPFLANSLPWLVKVDGQWSSPALQQLTAADVVLLVAGIAAAVLLCLQRIPGGTRFLLLLWIVAATIPLSSWKPLPKAMKYEYQAAGRLLIVAVGVLLLAALVLLPLRMRLSRRGWAWFAAAYGPVALLLLLFPVRPAGLTNYSEFRSAEAAGRVQYILRSPVPFSPTDRLEDQSGMKWVAPAGKHLMGTDRNSFDVLSRMIHASRIALFIGFIATGIALTIGVLIGGVMGFFSGRVDILGMRIIEVFDAIPTIFLLITFVAFFGRNIYIMMAIIGLTGWVGYARFIRAEFLKLRQQDFVHAAIAAGLPTRSVLFRHMLPNGIAPALVSASFGVASAILAESSLSFLGLGLVEEPSWGEMLNQAFGEGGGTFLWWMAVFPGIAIFLTVFSYNLIGESLRDALDPKLRKSTR